MKSNGYLNNVFIIIVTVEELINWCNVKRQHSNYYLFNYAIKMCNYQFFPTLLALTVGPKLLVMIKAPISISRSKSNFESESKPKTAINISKFNTSCGGGVNIAVFTFSS